MITSKPFALVTGLLILLAIDVSGGFLLWKTYQLSEQLDQNLALQGEQIARSIQISLGDELPSDQLDRLKELTPGLLKIENLKGILFIDRGGHPIAEAGVRIPPALISTFRQTEIYGLRDNGLYYLSVPMITTDYGNKNLTQEALPKGYTIFALNTAGIDKQIELLCQYFIAGSVLLAVLNLVALLWSISYLRHFNAYHKAPPEIKKQFVRGYKQLKQSIELQQLAIEKARQEALHTSEIKSRFIANMSHEIRTPLNAILGFTDLLLKSELDHRQRDFLATIRKSSLGLLQIINDILDFSKIEAGKVALDEIAIDLRETIEDVLTVLAPSAHEKQLEIILILSPELPDHILADPLRLKQILTNLVSNAVKFTDNGSITVRVNVEEQLSQQVTFKISVSDTGIGIAEEEQQKLFQAFSQVDTSTTREFGGSGLGLVIAKELVTQMNGTIGVNSKLHYGANFWFTFTAGLSHSPAQTLPLHPLSNKQIIIYDKHPLVRMSLAHLVSDWQAIPQSTGELPELEKIIDEKGELLAAAIISLNFDNTKSQKFRHILNKLENTWHCPTLVLHYTVDEDEERIKLAELASATLAKPVRYRELNQTLSGLIGPASQITSATTAAAVTRAVQFNRPPRILAVDDNPANLKLVSTMLGDLGALVTEASSGAQAIERLNESLFDLIFMDIQMPGMDGVETTSQIRRNPSCYRDTPIVALTAHALESERDTLLSSGMDDYLSKPVTEQQLINTILRWADIKIVDSGMSQKEIKTQQQQAACFFECTESRSITNGENNKIVVDQALGVKLAAGKEGLAQELFEMLLANLDSELKGIQQAYQDRDHQDLLSKVHRLHGATRYCGVPALKAAAEHLEVMLKRHQDGIAEGIERLLEESLLVKNWAVANPQPYRSQQEDNPG